MPALFREGVGAIGLRLDNVMADILHTVDQGVASHILGNILWYFAVIKMCFGGATHAERVKRCGSDLQAWYKNHRTITSRLQGALTAVRVRTSGSWPKLKAKAASTRHLVLYAVDLIRRFGELESPDDFTQLHDQPAAGVAQLLLEFYDILNRESMFLSQRARDRLPHLANDLRALYSRLSSMCFDARQRLWKLSPRFHLFLHVCLHQAIELGSPWFWWTYPDEDLVRILIAVAEGVNPTTLATSVLAKWLWCVFDELVVDIDD